MPSKPVTRARQSLRAPLAIFLTLLAGLACSLAHHFTNAYLDGRVVADTIISQAWVLRLGTIFAFLVKMFLTMSIGVAFVQRQWWSFQRQQFSIYEIDAVTAVLGDLFGLLTLSAWRKVPLLAVAAFISWTIPFAAVISPGSLSVVLTEANNTIPTIIPQPLFNNSLSFTDFAVEGSAQGALGLSDFTAKTELWQLALSVAVSGEMAALTMPYRNMTYRYQFYGPVIKCATVKNVTELTSTMSAAGQGNLTSTNYTSWVGNNLRFDKTLDRPLNNLTGSAIYVACGNGPGYDGSPATSRNTNVTECRLYNGSYDMAFGFRFPKQNLTLLKLEYAAPVSFDSIDNGRDITDWSSIAYAGIMEAFGRLLVGSITYPPPTGRSSRPPTINATSAKILHIDWSEAEATRTGLQQLFQNITLSLLSRSSFIKNSTQADQFPIFVFNSVNVYRYDQTDLFLTYGLALLGTLLCAIGGVHAIWANKASYRNTFSTFLRSSSNSDGLRSLLDADDNGRDPLPQKLGRIKLTMRKSSNGGL